MCDWIWLSIGRDRACSLLVLSHQKLPLSLLSRKNGDNMFVSTRRQDWMEYCKYLEFENSRKAVASCEAIPSSFFYSFIHLFIQMNFIIKHNYDIPPMLGYKYCYSKINFTATVLYTLFLYRKRNDGQKYVE